MFLGEYQHSLDDKARITIPAKFREGLGSSFIVTRGLDRCLFVFPTKDFEALEARLRAMPMARSDVRQFVRLLFSGASDCELDRQGRIVLPANLRDYAEIKRDCTVIGAGARVEIWDEGVWKNYSESASESFNELAGGLVDLDF